MLSFGWFQNKNLEQLPSNVLEFERMLGKFLETTKNRFIPEDEARINNRNRLFFFRNSKPIAGVDLQFPFDLSWGNGTGRIHGVKC